MQSQEEPIGDSPVEKKSYHLPCGLHFLGGEDIEGDKLDDKLILMYVPYAIARMERSQNLTVAELRQYKKQSKEFFDFARTQCCEDHIAFLSSYRKDPYFGVYIEKMLSSKGLEWIRHNYPLIRQVAEEPG